MKRKLLLITAALFLCMAAHAQTGDFCLFHPVGNTDQTLIYLQSGPSFGFSSWACQAPGTFIKYPMSKYWHWTSTCFQGGIIFQDTYIEGNDTQIEVDSGIFDPLTGRTLGYYSGFGYVAVVGNQWLPAFIPTEDYGNVPCDTATHTTMNQSLVVETQ